MTRCLGVSKIQILSKKRKKEEEVVVCKVLKRVEPRPKRVGTWIINKRLWGFWPFGSFYPQHFPLFGNTPRMKKLFQWISNPWPQALLDKPQWLWFKPLPTRYIYKTHICIYTYARIVSSQLSASLLRLVSNKVLVKDLEISSAFKFLFEIFSFGFQGSQACNQCGIVMYI